MKTVALVGMAQTTRDLAPWDNEDIEIWTLNESPAKRFNFVKRTTRHFQLHPLWSCMRPHNQNDPEHPQWLRAQKDFPIYMQDHYDEIPASVKYPLEEVFEHFKIPLDQDDHWKEFTNTMPYMIALALYEGFDRIEIYGFEMGSETEYAYQRPAVHLWLGIARGLYLAAGKPEIYIPERSELLGKGLPLYGYDQILQLNPMEIEIDRNRFANEAQISEATMNDLQGRQAEINDIVKGIRAKYSNRAKEIEAKKIDPKLRQRRLAALGKEMQREIAPYAKQQQQLEIQRMDTFGRLNFQKGAASILESQLTRYNGQKPKEIKPLEMKIRNA